MKIAIKDAMKSAMKARDAVRLSTIRSLLAAIQYQELQREVESLTDDETLAIIQSEIKKRNEESEYAKQAKRDDLLTKLDQEIAALRTFLPKQLTEGELEKIVASIKSETPATNVGAVMKVLKERYSGQYDGKLASEVAKRLLV